MAKGWYGLKDGKETMSIRKIIKERLEHTLDCSFKRELVRHLLGEGWAIVNIEEFSKDLETVIKKGVKDGS